MAEKIEPLGSYRELSLAHADDRGPWPALYQLRDAYERLEKLNDRLRQSGFREAEKSERLQSLLAEALPYLEDVRDVGTDEQGWKSPELLALMAKIATATGQKTPYA